MKPDSRRVIIGGVALVLAGAPGPARGQSLVQNPHVVISLIPERTAAQRGTSFGIALRFALEPGWHIYWRNPGESGIATSLEWRLPAGWSADTVAWPTPQRADIAGIVTHVLDGEVILATRIQVPASAAGTADIGLRVTYGVCRDTCIPGNATLAVPMPVSPEDRSSTPAWQRSRASLLARLPIASGPVSSARLEDTIVVLTLRGRAGSTLKPGTWTFFPSDRPVARAAVSVEAPRGARDVVLRIALAECTPARLNGVLVHGNPETASRGYAVSVPLKGVVSDQQSAISCR